MDHREELLDTYIEEAGELLVEMEDGLLALEENGSDDDLLNAVFRTAHTIKGSAGIFGFKDIVDFTHRVESVLARMREHRIAFSPQLGSLLLKCHDHMAALVELIAKKAGSLTDELAERGRTLGDRLGEYLLDPALPTPVAGATEVQAIDPPATNIWHISVRFGRDVFRTGNDPLLILRHLESMAEHMTVVPVTDALPNWEDFDPESCYLGFEINLIGPMERAAIEQAFEFVEDHCELEILGPDAQLKDYVALIEQMPETPRRLGEILLACGAISQSDLQHCLDLQARPALGEVVVSTGVAPQQVVDAALQKQQTAKGRKALSIRVQAEKLDRLINLVGELVSASATASLFATQSGAADVQEANLAVANLVDDIRDSALQLRMVQVGDVFNRFPRVVRDLSGELGKQLELSIQGADTELDKTVIDQIGDPLMHLVRNAIDHGIESERERAASGKNPIGQVGLNAYHDSGSIVIEVSDDGRGIDPARIRQVAIGKGLVGADDVLSQSDIHDLLFHPGFSSAEKITDVSGRGVGMDVVKQNIESLRGTVVVESEPGHGSTFRIRLPLTLAIIDGFLIGVGSSKYVVPLDNVVECVELTAQHRRESRHRNFVNLRGEALPILRLRDYFRATGPSSIRENVVVVTVENRKVGLIVDALLGEHQTVLKPLGGLFKRVQELASSTVLGSGEVALVLNVPALVAQARKSENEALANGCQAVAKESR